MIHELNETDYSRVRPLFQPLEFQLFCAGVLEGRYPGRVFADDPVAPRAALLITREVWGFLAGNPDNAAFNRALNQAIFSREIVDEQAWGLLLSCTPESWERALAVVCAPRQPIKAGRRHYICRQLTYDWRASVPRGFVVQQIDETLLERPAQELSHDVRNLLAAGIATDDDLRSGFGFVALHRGKIAAYALVDCVVGDGGDIGLFADEKYRRLGLATATSAATLEYGLSHGLSWIAWDCAVGNIASIRTAEKLGLTHERDHQMYYFDIDEGQ